MQNLFIFVESKKLCYYEQNCVPKGIPELPLVCPSECEEKNILYMKNKATF